MDKFIQYFNSTKIILKIYINKFFFKKIILPLYFVNLKNKKT